MLPPLVYGHLFFWNGLTRSTLRRGMPVQTLQRRLRNDMSRSRDKIVNQDTPYFLTSTVVNWLPIFGTPAVTLIILNSLRFLQQSQRLTIFAYVIMEHHLHLVASGPDLSKAMSSFKSYTARQIIE